MVKSNSGIFISLEGPDGAGKTTQLKLLSKYLDSVNCQYIITRDPGGTPLGKQIRRIVLHSEGDVSPVAELLLYQADRAQHVSEIIGPALKKGLVVLCDRYVDSTLAYQGYGRNIDLGLIRQLNEIATGGLMPELTILFDIDSEAGLSRLHPSGHDRLEREATDFHTRVRNGYLALAKAEPQRWRVIDAGRAMSAVQEDLQSIIAEKLGVTV
ncbi:MAG: dTMP kinase [Candidatus Obscuribacterales bacterium]|nr:dTMP kinase [Candidatus Obscuribacterales bacterium]